MNGNMRAENVAIGVEYAQGKEHCIGYHVKDEPGGDLLPAIGQQMRAYREADPTRYPFTNLLPSYAGEAWLGGTYREHVQNYVDAVGAENIEYLSHDYYPFRSGNVTMQDIFADMEVMRAVAYENGKLKTHAFPQSTQWNGTRMSDIDEMRWNVYGYLAYGFKALSWFNLVCPGKSDTEGEGFSESLIYRDGQIHDPELFAAWSELNWEIRGLSDILMNADTVHAYHTRKTVKNVEYLPADFYLKPTKTMDFIVSEMESKDGAEKYIMLYNKNLKAKATTSVSFSIDPASGITGIEYFDPFIGEYIKMDISDGIASDLGHILRASGVGAEVDLDALPISAELRSVATRKGWNIAELAASAGEDYQLLVVGTADLPAKAGITLHPIGRITSGSGVVWLEGGVATDFDKVGFKHF